MRRSARALLPAVLALQPRSVVIDPNLVEPVMRLAQRFAVLPRAASRIDRTRLPDDLVERLDAELLENTARIALLKNEAQAIARILGRHGIDCVLIKGAGMVAAGMLCELGDRHMDDIDLLLPPDRIDEARALFAANGFEFAERFATAGVDGRPVAEQAHHAATHAERGLVTPAGVELDIHHHVPDARVSRFEDVARACIRHDLGGATVLVPSPALMLAHLCEHVVRHHQFRPSYVPRHLSDVATLAGTPDAPIWSEALAYGDRFSIELSRRAFAVALRWPESAPLLFPSEDVRVAIEVCWEMRDIAGRLRRDIATDPAQILRKLVPAPDYVARSYDTQPDDPRLPLFYVHRLVTLRWLFRPHRG